MERMRKPEEAALAHQAQNPDEQEQLEDDGRAWCGVRTYITGPQAIKAGASATFSSNVHVDADRGCRSQNVDEVVWSVDAPAQYKDQIHIRTQSIENCSISIESGVPPGTEFTLHATPKAHALAKGANTRIACQVNKADAQTINVS